MDARNQKGHILVALFVVLLLLFYVCSLIAKNYLAIGGFILFSSIVVGLGWIIYRISIQPAYEVRDYLETVQDYRNAKKYLREQAARLRDARLESDRLLLNQTRRIMADGSRRLASTQKMRNIISSSIAELHTRLFEQSTKDAQLVALAWEELIQQVSSSGLPIAEKARMIASLAAETRKLRLMEDEQIWLCKIGSSPEAVELRTEEIVNDLASHSPSIRLVSSGASKPELSPEEWLAQYLGDSPRSLNRIRSDALERTHSEPTTD